MSPASNEFTSNVRPVQAGIFDDTNPIVLMSGNASAVEFLVSLTIINTDTASIVPKVRLHNTDKSGEDDEYIQLLPEITLATNERVTLKKNQFFLANQDLEIELPSDATSQQPQFILERGFDITVSGVNADQDITVYDDQGRPKNLIVVENKTPTLAFFTAGNAVPPTSNYATRDTRDIVQVLDFDATTNETTYFIGKMPQQYAGGSVDVILTFSSVATSGDVDWDVSFARLAEDDIDIDSVSFGSATSIDGTSVNATSGKLMIATATITSGANMNSVVAGDMFVLQITRDATSDTSASDAELLGVEIRGT